MSNSVFLCPSFWLPLPLCSLTTLPLPLGWIDIQFLNFWLLNATTTSHSPTSVERPHPVPLNAWTLCVCVFVCAVGCVYIILYYIMIHVPLLLRTAGHRALFGGWGSLFFSLASSYRIVSHRIVSHCAATVPTMTAVIVTLTGVAFLILIHFTSVRSLDFYL